MNLAILSQIAFMHSDKAHVTDVAVCSAINSGQEFEVAERLHQSLLPHFFHVPK